MCLLVEVEDRYMLVGSEDMGRGIPIIHKNLILTLTVNQTVTDILSGCPDL